MSGAHRTDVAIPGWLGGSLAALVGLAAGIGLLSRKSWPERLSRASFFASGLAYLGVTLVDIAEHLRLEKEATGSYFSAVAVPRAESYTHLAFFTAQGLCLKMAQLQGRSLRAPKTLRFAAPLLLLGSGWIDELIFHRRRTQHREDIIHTAAHVANAAMLASFTALQLTRQAER
jgi:hypothetical protein